MRYRERKITDFNLAKLNSKFLPFMFLLFCLSTFAQEEDEATLLQFHTIRAMIFKSDAGEFREVAVVQKTGFVSFGEELIIIENEEHKEKQYIEILSVEKDTVSNEMKYKCIKYDEECEIHLAMDSSYFALLEDNKLFKYELCTPNDFLEEWSIEKPDLEEDIINDDEEQKTNKEITEPSEENAELEEGNNETDEQ